MGLEGLSDRLLNPIFDWRGPVLLSLNDLPGRSDLDVFAVQAEHEADIESWKAEYRDGKNGVFDGHEIRTEPDVFPAEKGDTSRDIVLAIRELQHYHERFGTPGHRIALDMGCGNGAIAMSLATLSTFDKVYGIDNHIPAVKNAEKNFENSKFKDKLEVIQSDLMSDVPLTVEVDGRSKDLKFDLIVFNQPYYPREGSPDFGLGPDGGEKIIRRFFEEIEGYIHEQSEIIMPFSTDVDGRHDPATIAEELGYTVSILRERIDENGNAHRVYRFVKDDVFSGTLPVVTIENRTPQPIEDCLYLAA